MPLARCALLNILAQVIEDRFTAVLDRCPGGDLAKRAEDRQQVSADHLRCQQLWKLVTATK